MNPVTVTVIPNSWSLVKIKSLDRCWFIKTADAPLPISETVSFVVTVVPTTLGGAVLFDVRVGIDVVLPVMVLLVRVWFVVDAAAPPAELALLANNLLAMLLHFMSALDTTIYELISSWKAWYGHFPMLIQNVHSVYVFFSLFSFVFPVVNVRIRCSM